MLSVGKIDAGEPLLVSSSSDINGSAEGDIFHRSLSIDENARFEGSSRREETVIDAPRIPIIRPEAQADVDTVVAMEGSRKHNGPLENKWRANE
jgi:cytoskeletal protein CcmA (bactofilin family)